jgi:putative transposase
VFADSIYDRLAALLACFLFGLALIVVRRAAGTTGFVVQPRRWVVERSLGWLGRWQRLSKDYEELPEVSEAMVTLAMIRLMLHRVVQPNRSLNACRARSIAMAPRRRMVGRAGEAGAGTFAQSKNAARVEAATATTKRASLKPDATLKPDLTLEHVLAAAIARRVTDGSDPHGEACALGLPMQLS